MLNYNEINGTLISCEQNLYSHLYSLIFVEGVKNFVTLDNI